MASVVDLSGRQSLIALVTSTFRECACLVGTATSRTAQGSSYTEPLIYWCFLCLGARLVTTRCIYVDNIYVLLIAFVCILLLEFKLLVVVQLRHHSLQLGAPDFDISRLDLRQVFRFPADNRMSYLLQLSQRVLCLSRHGFLRFHGLVELAAIVRLLNLNNVAFAACNFSWVHIWVRCRCLLFIGPTWFIVHRLLVISFQVWLLAFGAIFDLINRLLVRVVVKLESASDRVFFAFHYCGLYRFVIFFDMLVTFLRSCVVGQLDRRELLMWWWLIVDWTAISPVLQPGLTIWNGS